MNGYSIVIRMVYKKTSFLFTGVADEKSEKEMLAKKYKLKSDVLKVSHHGSYTATSAKFLKKVKPKYAVISCGAGNMYGHPHNVVMKRLKNQKVKLFRTDLQGTVIATSDGKKITWNVGNTKNYQGGGDGREDEPEEKSKDKTGTDEKKRNDDKTVNKNIPLNVKYVLNTNTKKIHLPYCNSVNEMLDKNKAFTDKEISELKREGYTCCQRCLKGK